MNTLYVIQFMFNSFETVELAINAIDKETAMRTALSTEGIDPKEVCMSAVFEEGCNISLPIESISRYIPSKYCLFMINQHGEMASSCTMEEAERLYGAELKLMMNGRSAHAVMLFTRFDKEVYEVQDEAHQHNIS